MRAIKPLSPPPRRSPALRLAFAAYDAAVWAAVAGVLAPAGLLATARGRSPMHHLRERLGRPPEALSGRRPRVLVHAVSAGEVAAASALIAALVEEQATISLVLTTGTQEGRAVGEALRELHPQVEAVAYLPWDLHLPLRAWLRAVDLDALLVVETEIWPNLLRAAADLAIPVAIVSGRMNPRDAGRYRRASWFFRPLLAGVRWIGVRNELDRAGFEAAGAPCERLEVMGDLKHDAAPRLEPPAAWVATLAGLQGAPLIVAGSTHPPEEECVLEALRTVRRRWPGTRVLLAPRHPTRAAVVSRRAAATGFETVRWSDPTALSGDWDVLVLDRIGVLAAIYRFADVVVVGGSLGRRGGHNPLEAAVHGRPIVIGPSFEHFSEVVAGLAAAAGVLVLPSGRDVTEALAAALLELLGDPARRTEMGGRALEYAQSRRGVAGRYARRVLATLAAAQ